MTINATIIFLIEQSKPYEIQLNEKSAREANILKKT